MAEFDFDIDDYRLSPSREAPGQRKDGVLPQPRPGERYLAGRIPRGWIERACCLPGKALHVSIWLWHLARMKKRNPVSLNQSRMEHLGVKRHAAGRALRQLEEAGLVSVNRGQGRNPLVTILDHRQFRGSTAGEWSG